MHKITKRFYLVPSRIALIKETEMKNTGEGVETKEPLYVLIGNFNYSHYCGWGKKTRRLYSPTMGICLIVFESKMPTTDSSFAYLLLG